MFHFAEKGYKIDNPQPKVDKQKFAVYLRAIFRRVKG